jgi:hypothetical protein
VKTETLVQLVQLSTQLLLIVPEAIAKLKAARAAGELDATGDGELDRVLDAWAESNRELSASIQSLRTPT